MTGSRSGHGDDPDRDPFTPEERLEALTAQLLLQAVMRDDVRVVEHATRIGPGFGAATVALRSEDGDGWSSVVLRADRPWARLERDGEEMRLGVQLSQGYEWSDDGPVPPTGEPPGTYGAGDRPGIEATREGEGTPSTGTPGLSFRDCGTARSLAREVLAAMTRGW